MYMEVGFDKTDYWMSQPADVSLEADRAYSREAAVYEHLERTGNTGDYAAKYYGSWTLVHEFDREGRQVSRPVRLILLEDLNGRSLKELYEHPPTKPTTEAERIAFEKETKDRLDLVALAADGAVRLRHAGVRYSCFCAQHMILVERPGSAKPRIVHISFSRSYLFHHRRDVLWGRECKYSDDSTPPNPIDVLWRCYNFLDGLIPENWNRNRRHMYREWLWERFSGENALLYLALKRKGLYYTPSDDIGEPSVESSVESSDDES
ncbi:hypothetical protein F5Y17DRAFT_448809 [Xylariaceae sp. FL0594]|nr:hypothetical protein F5Y17DRAFT_448809 [Xylariaceae sp. FL0594]